MRILYAGMKYDYGNPDRGHSFEHHNFYDALCHTSDHLIYFDFMSLLQKVGKRRMNARLLEVVKSEKPDLMFTILFKDELDADVLKEISTRTSTVTLNWFCDDHWRFEDFSRHWAPCFNWVVTTAQSAVSKYAAIGYSNLIKSQWACNHFTYRKLNLPFQYDVSFVGQPHGNRREIIQRLADKGIAVHTFGLGWNAGRVSQEEMIRIFNQSRINLNLSNASVHGSKPTGTVNRAAERLAPLVQKVPYTQGLRKAGTKLLRMMDRPSAMQPASESSPSTEQIKGRNFEVPGCGGFLLTGHADNLEEYYALNKEVVCFNDDASLADSIQYYLKHEDARAAVADAGYSRTLQQHTYSHRFRDIFERLQLPGIPSEDARIRAQVDEVV